MSYTTYITDALVCGTKDSNTSDKSFLLFTREAGMLFASARSVRMEKSKQRFALQEFALIRVTLIRGKSGWRIGSVDAKDNYYHTAKDKAARGSVVRVFRQLRRFIHGEEPAVQLFDFVTDALEIIHTDVEHRTFVDSVVQLRLMRLLGYVAEKDIPPVLRDAPIDQIDMLYEDTLKTTLERVLTQAVTVSQL